MSNLFSHTLESSGGLGLGRFNGDISKWDVSKVEDMDNMFKQSPLEGNEPAWYKG